jgi:hypothetical protein
VSERRRDYMVSKRVHFLYMLTWVNSLLLVGAFAALVWTLIRSGQARNVPNFLGMNPFLLVGILAFIIVCTALILGVYTIVHTHRLLGSAYRIGVVLRLIHEGKPDRIKLRDGDFFMDIGDEVNSLADKYHALTGASASSAPAAAEGAAEGAAGSAGGDEAST